MSPRSRTIAWVAGGALVSVVLAAIALGTDRIADFVAAVAGLALLIAPGILLRITRRPGRSIGLLHLLLASTALSLSSIVIGGLVLNLLPGGLDRTAWLGLVVVLLLVTAFLARGDGTPLRLPQVALPGWRTSTTMLAALAITVAALAVAGAGVRQPSEPYSALWVAPAAPGQVTIGLDNHQATAATYRLDVTADGRLQASYGPITVPAGERWTTTYPVPKAGDPRLDVNLYLASRPDLVYRRVTVSPAG